MTTYPPTVGDIRRPALEHRGHARGEDERAGNLDEHRQPIRHVVAVVRGGEPGEVHPRPPDGEEHHQVADEARERVRVGDGMVQSGGRLRDRDDEDEIEQQLQGRGGAVRLVRRSPGHARSEAEPRGSS